MPRINDKLLSQQAASKRASEKASQTNNTQKLKFYALPPTPSRKKGKLKIIQRTLRVK